MVGFSIEVIDLGIRNSVCDSTDGLSEMRGIVLLVQLRGRKALYDVLSVHGESLDNGAQWEERESVGRHDARSNWTRSILAR